MKETALRLASVIRSFEVERGCLTVGGMPLDMLKQIRGFVAGYEADHFPLWLWEEAILQGYAVFRYLREHRRGRVTIDMANRTLRVSTIP